MSDMHLPPEQVNDQDFAAERDSLQGGADLMLKLMSKKLELVCITDQTGGILTLVPAGTETGDTQRLDDLHQRVERIEATLDAGNGQATVYPALAATAARPADLVEAGITGRSTRGRLMTDKSRRRTNLAVSPQLPEEVSTVQAADILGVSKDTVLAYRQKGLLPFRDLAPPGSTKPIYMFPLEAVVKFRTTYQTEQPAPRQQNMPPRRRVKGERRYKHLDFGD